MGSFGGVVDGEESVDVGPVELGLGLLDHFRVRKGRIGMGAWLK